MDAQQLFDINDRFSRGCGKWFCMFGGMSTRLEDYRDATLYLVISISDYWWKKRDPLSIVFQMARYYRIIEELRGASYFNATCSFKSGGRQLMHVFDPTKSDDDVVEKRWQETMLLRIPPNATELITITISGHIDADIPADWSPNRKYSGYRLNYDEKAGFN